MPGRFDVDLLDPEDPFELDADNWPHLYKHSFVRPDGRALRIELPDIIDLLASGACLFYPADLAIGQAHWLLLGEIEGLVLTVPLAPPRSGDPTKCRPIGLYEASKAEQDAYRRDV